MNKKSDGKRINESRNKFKKISKSTGEFDRPSCSGTAENTAASKLTKPYPLQGDSSTAAAGSR